MAFENMNPILLAFLAGCFTWLMTALGAATVFIGRELSKRTLDTMYGFAAGVMIAASFWSLLAPSIEIAEKIGTGPSWLPAAVGFLAGGAFIRLFDMFLPHLHPNMPDGKAEGVETSLPKSTLLILAITLHNIPEGLAVGIAFGAAAAGYPEASIAGATTLALGIGIQNLPEGLAVSAPLRREGFSKGKSFFWGQFSGLMEPLGAVVGASVLFIAQPILPYALAFAAGAMIFVVAEELIPEAQSSGNSDYATGGLMVGFTLMMVLDVALG